MPDTLPDCLTGLLGLSASGVPCFALPTTGDTAYITDSASGLYLDKAEGLLLRPATGQSAGGDLYARLDNARVQALPVVRAELAKGRTSLGAALYGQRGTLGGLGNGALQPVGTPAKISFYTQIRPFGALRLESLNLYTDVAVADIAVLLDGALVGTLSAGGPGGTFTALTGEPVRVPLDGSLHTLEAVLPAGVRVRANQMWCSGCQRNTPWGQSLARNLVESQCASAGGGGFAVQVLEECTEARDPLCYAMSADPELQRAVALAVLYKAAELFILSLSVGATANRYLMLEPKELDQLGAYYAAKNHNPTDGYLPWLAGPDGLARIKHPCYAGPPARMGKYRTT